MEEQLSSAVQPVLNAEGEAMIELDPFTQKFIWIGVAVYVAVMLLIGWWSGRKIKDLGDFLVAGRRLPLWMATATLLATWFGAGSSMGVAATIYNGELRDVIADPFGASISLVLAGIFVVGVLRKLRCMTVTDIVQRRFGRGAGIYVSLWMVPVYVGWLGAQVLGLGTLLNLLTGIDLFWARLAGGLVVLIYTITGGMWAVTLTDVVQVALIIIGLFLIVPEAIHMAGGWDVLMSQPDLDLSLLPKTGAATGFHGWINYTGNWLIMGLGCMVGQDLIQRSLASRNSKIAISSSIMSGFFYLMIAMVPITIGIAAKVLLPKWGITSELMGSNLENQVLPRIAIGVMGVGHPLLLTLFLSALVSAIMSSADSSLLAASSLLSNNVVRPLFPQISDKYSLIMTRIATLLVLVIAILLAMCVESIYALMINCWASQLVVVFIPVLAGIYSKTVSKNAIWCTMLTSSVVWVVYIFVQSAGISGSFSEVLNSDVFQFELTNGAVYGFFAGLIAFFTSWAGERISRKYRADVIQTPIDEAED